MYKFFFAILFSTFSFTALAQRISVEEYIEQFKDIAIREMKRSGVPASITLAQGILESESGNSDLVKRSNNHFGIKCKSSWTGESVSHDDDATGECFRAYTSADESFKDHSDFLKVNKRYSSLFNLDPADYAGWARGLKKAGYATNPRYPDLLIKYVEQYNLQSYSLMALNKSPESGVTVDIETQGATTNQQIVSETVVAEQKEAYSDPAVKLTRINKTKCIFVEKGTSLLAIAQKNNISLSKLMEFNDISEEGLLAVDQYIFLQKKPKTGENDFYIVQPGETIYDVAQKTGVQLRYLIEYNSLAGNSKLAANSKLFLRPGLLAMNAKKIHFVAPKEGLYAIARTYQVTVQQLKEWNKLESDELKIGQEIIVSK